MSWHRLARPRDLVGSLVRRGDDRATTFFLKEIPNKIAWSAQHNQKKTYLSPDSFERPGGGGGDHTRAHQSLSPWPAATAYGFLASEKSKPWLVRVKDKKDSVKINISVESRNVDLNFLRGLILS